MSEKEITIDFNVVQIAKLGLEPGDVLVAKCKGPDFQDPEVLHSLQNQLKLIFPRNQVLALFLGDNELDLQVLASDESIFVESGGSCATADSACKNCSCGKKERLEAENVGCSDPSCCSE